ncbi:porin [Agarivorans aestuarii]|uniref:Porin n=1 Tax=Agarivorans aestuarii TaxID=1563703 RepID=A0ABU7GBT7_9ALTE|nr:porin [Agarivorans aestuarii]MEE1675940.1 porin [Agarivorans aestuarii]
MKKTILAVAIPALFAASAQAANVYDADGVSADVYGRMQFDIRDDNTNTDAVGSARMGFKAQSEIATGVSGFAKGEWQIAAEDADSSKFTARHLYVGFDFEDSGKVIFGQTDTAFYTAVAPTDIFNSFGYGAYTLVEDGRQEGQIIYSGEFGGFILDASYQFRNPDFQVGVGNPEDTSYVDLGAELDSAYAATLGYNFDFGLGLYGGYHVEKFKDGDKKNMALSASYSWEALYLGAAYVNAKTDDAKLDGYDLVVSYDINAVSLYAGYAYQKASGDATLVDGGTMTFDDLGDWVKQSTLGVSYKFNSNMKVWGEYLVDNGKGVDTEGAAPALTDADNQWRIAVQYNF